ncbi:unnamed protein product [Arabis nemorensis]|uniref:Uncharacterized protein n=1 Tax=Arabis nemorensis TaxID=586526 RepID=A0A565BBQ9_9BRAS|nr:unnamed protein product [Arabis nemorensis]
MASGEGKARSEDISRCGEAIRRKRRDSPRSTAKCLPTRTTGSAGKRKNGGKSMDEIRGGNGCFK